MFHESRPERKQSSQLAPRGFIWRHHVQVASNTVSAGLNADQFIFQNTGIVIGNPRRWKPHPTYCNLPLCPVRTSSAQEVKQSVHMHLPHRSNLAVSPFATGAIVQFWPNVPDAQTEDGKPPKHFGRRCSGRWIGSSGTADMPLPGRTTHPGGVHRCPSARRV
jgi:hypothetical protein